MGYFILINESMQQGKLTMAPSININGPKNRPPPYMKLK
jgi:hypothetical protein